MIYDDQQEMGEHVAQRLVALYGFVPNPSTVCVEKVLEDAFAAIDREALVEKVARAYAVRADGREQNWPVYQGTVEHVLIAAGVIPERP